MAAVNRSMLVAACLACAAAIRIAAAALLPDQSALLVDAPGYREAAVELLQSGTVSRYYIMPLYPLVVAVAGPGAGQLAADIVLSVCIVWLVYALTLEIFADRMAALLAGFGAAVYPPLIYFSVVGLSETLFIALILAAFLCWYRCAFLLASIFAVLAILTRPIFEPAAILLLLCFAIAVCRKPTAGVAKSLAIYVVIYAALLAPWWLHNYKLYGTFVRLNLGAGIVLYSGNNPLNRSGGGNMGEDYDPEPFEGIADLVERDRAYRAAAIGYMLDNPWRTIEAAGQKFVRMWRPWPRHEGYSGPFAILVAAASILPLYGLTLLYLLIWGPREFRRVSPILLFMCYLTAIHMIMTGTVRYRLPLEPFLIVFSSVALGRIVRQWSPAKVALEG